MKELLVVVSLLGLGLGTSYDQYKVYKVSPETAEKTEVLRKLEKNPHYDFWSQLNKVSDPVSIMVAPEEQYQFEMLLLANEISYKLEIDDVQRTINEEASYHAARKGRIALDQYQRYEEINEYLVQVRNDKPNEVQLITTGVSYENRVVYLLRIHSGTLNKPVIFIECGNHAREWISPALCLSIIDQLLYNPENSYLLDKLEWVILPLLNPDGYEYTWTTNRMWRKTRSPGTVCDGVDGNRNFGFHWMEQGASANPCSETYAGPSEFSEPEARNLETALRSFRNTKAFISVHSYGQYLFYPFSYASVVPPNWRELHELAQATNDAIAAVNGTQYKVGASTELLYPAAGCSDDYAMGVAGIDIVLTFELPGGGAQGFDLPASRILPVTAETWEGIKVIANYVIENRS